jgi:hypothetical protein
MKKWVWKIMVAQTMSDNSFLINFGWIVFLLFITTPVWLEILHLLKRKKLPVISEDNFYKSLKEKYNIPKDFALLMRKKVAHILHFPEEKLSPLYSFDFISKNFWSIFQTCDYDFYLIEEARDQNVQLPSDVNLETIADLIYWFWYIQSTANTRNNL